MEGLGKLRVSTSIAHETVSLGHEIGKDHRDANGGCDTSTRTADACSRPSRQFCKLSISLWAILFVAYEIVTSVMPRAFACSYISPSTSLDTAEVHSSRTANCGR